MTPHPDVKYVMAPDGEILKKAQDLGELILPMRNGSVMLTILEDCLGELEAKRLLKVFTLTTGRPIYYGGAVWAKEIDAMAAKYEDVDPIV